MLKQKLFGETAKQWRDKNMDKKGNVRDYAGLDQLLVLANMESYNAILIEQGKVMSERLVLLRKMAVKQLKTMKSLSLSALPSSQSRDFNEESENQ